MQDLWRNQPTQYQRGEHAAELRGQRIIPLKIEHHAQRSKQEKQMPENVPR